MYASASRRHARRTDQRGIALAVSLILLVVITLIGLAAARGTTAQQKMTTNFLDRGIAFQQTEAALRVGADAIATSAIGQRNCAAGGITCPVNPFADPNLADESIRSALAYVRGANAASQPQYVVDNMGLWDDPDLDTGFDQTANAAQYGAQGTTIQSQHYRITARSGDPTETGDRSMVTLQAFYKR